MKLTEVCVKYCFQGIWYSFLYSSSFTFTLFSLKNSDRGKYEVQASGGT